MKFETMRNVVYLLVVCFVLFGCAGTNVGTSEDKSEKDYKTNLNLSNNQGLVELYITIPVEKSSSQGTDTGDIKGGKIDLPIDLDLTYKQMLEEALKEKVQDDIKEKLDIPSEGGETEDETEEIDDKTYIKTKDFWEFKKGSTGIYNGSSVIQMCLGDFLYKRCFINDNEMKDNNHGDKGRQMFYYSKLYNEAEIKCEGKDGKYYLFQVSLGETGECYDPSKLK